MSQESNYPLHVGVTETGTPRMGVLKSAIGIGGLLALLSSIIIYVVYGGINYKVHFESAFLWPKSVKDFAQMFGVCCLCFAVPFYGTSSQRSMDDKQKFPAVLYGSLLFSGLFYIVVGVGCSLLYNQRGRAMGC